ncbi:glycosyltransferase [soil metagenome]
MSETVSSGGSTGPELVGVCTIVRGRRPHLRNLLLGLAAQTRPPDVVAIAAMGGEPLQGVEEGLDLPIRWVDAASALTPLPLAAARNAARRTAGHVDHLVFLDVDVIPSPTLVEEYAGRLAATPGIWSGHVDYLPPGAAAPGWTPASLTAAGTPNAARPRVPADRPLSRPELFWSLSFALPATVFDGLGGFDERYQGYGAEDTDFGLRAAAMGVALWTACDAVGWHQHHPSSSPPVQHLADIVTNATVFRRRWGRWPMEGWLAAFADRGLVEWTPEADHLALACPETATALCPTGPQSRMMPVV